MCVCVFYLDSVQCTRVSTQEKGPVGRLFVVHTVEDIWHTFGTDFFPPFFFVVICSMHRIFAGVYFTVRYYSQLQLNCSSSMQRDSKNGDKGCVGGDVKQAANIFPILHANHIS